MKDEPSSAAPKLRETSAMASMSIPKGIRKRGLKYFVDVTHNGKRKTGTRDTLAEAMELRSELLSGPQSGKDVKVARSNAARWTLKQALDKTLSMPKPEGWRGTSYEKQATMNAQDAISFFGPNTRLEDLSRERIDAWLHSCEQRGNSDSTINRKRSALNKLAKVALDYDGLSAPLKMPRQRVEPVGRIRQISPEEERQIYQFLKTMGDHEMAEAVLVLIDTGMRRGELLNLRPTDVDLKTGVIMVYGVEGKGTKNGKIRSVPMTKAVRGVLQNRTTGARCFNLSESHMRHVWDRLRSHMGLTSDKDFTLHVCRHTCASRLVQKGVSLHVVQQWLGHSNITTTMRYAHLYPSDLMNAVKALEGD